MTVREVLNNIKQSEIFKLVFNGQVLGLRVKSYNPKSNRFDYYDFELELLTDNTMISFIKEIKNMRSIELYRHNGMLLSDEEIKNNVVILEFEYEAKALEVLRPFVRIYASKG